MSATAGRRPARPRFSSVDLDADLAVLDAVEHAAEALAARERLLQLDLASWPGPALEIRGPHQRPVDAGRGNLEL